MHAGRRRRHADHSQKRRERDRKAFVVGPALPVKRPVEHGVVREGHAPRTRLHLVDPDGERLAGASAPHLDRPRERVASVELGIAVGEELALGLPPPPRIQRLEAD